MIGRNEFLCVSALLALGAAPPAGRESLRAGDKGPPGRNEPIRIDRQGDPLPPGAFVRIGTIRLRHPGPVTSVLFTPDGTKVITGGPVESELANTEEDAVASIGRAIRVWDPDTGRPLRQFGTQPAGVGCLAISVDGKLLASEGANSSVCLWDLASGTPLSEISLDGEPMGNFMAVTFSPDGKTVATIGSGDCIRIWDVASGQENRRFGKGGVAIAFAPDGKTLFDGTRLWDTKTGQQRRRFPNSEPAGNHAVAFSPDGKTLAVGQADGTLLILATDSGREVQRCHDEDGCIHAIAFSADGKSLVSGNATGSSRLWNVATGKQNQLFKGHDGSVLTVAFSPDGKRIATGGEDHTVKLWDVATGRQRPVFGGPDRGVGHVAFSPNGKILASGDDRAVRLWDPARIAQVGKWDSEDHFSGVLVFGPGGAMLASAESGSVIHVREVATGKTVRRIEWPHGFVSALDFSPDGRALASAGTNTSPRVWEVATGKELLCLPKEAEKAGQPSCIAFSPDGRFLACSGETGVIQLWSWPASKLLHRLVLQEGEFSCFAFSPDGKYLATGGDDQTIRLWDPQTGKQRVTIEGHVSAVQSVVFSPDSRLLASTGTGDRNAHLWEVTSGQEVLQLKGHQDIVSSVSFSPDGLHLTTASLDATILIWDLAALSTEDLKQVGTRPAQQIEEFWADLGSGDAAKAYRAFRHLAAKAEQAIPFMHQRLRPTPRVTRGRLEALIVDLDADLFATRAKAAAELMEYDAAAGPVLAASLRTPLSAEVHRRVGDFLERIETPLPPVDVLRTMRAIAILERSGTREARVLLSGLAQGAPEARQTLEANASLKRLARRPLAAR